MAQKRKNAGIQLRTPKTKSKLGLSIPRIGLPHDEFVKADSSRESELMSVLGMTSPTDATDRSGRVDTTGRGSMTSPTITDVITGPTGPTITETAISNDSETEYPAIPTVIELEPTPTIPDFAELALDTTSRDALTTRPTHTNPPSQTAPPTSIPKELFTQAPADPLPGKSRTLYTVLRGLTHGAETPTPSIRMRRADLMRLAGIGSRNTFIANLRRLEAAGLVRQTVIVGEADGNEFHVTDFPPPSQNTAQTGQTSLTAVTARQSESVDTLTESLITAIAQSGATPEALANALEQAARQLREGK